MTTAPLLCTGCLYDLQRTDPDGACPECGRPVADTMARDLRRSADPDWLAQMRRGSWRLFLWTVLILPGFVLGSLLTSALFALAAFAGALGGAQGPPVGLFAAAGLGSFVPPTVFLVLSVLALRRLCRPDPNGTLDPLVPRRLAARCASGLLLSLLLAVLVTIGVGVLGVTSAVSLDVMLALEPLVALPWYGSALLGALATGAGLRALGDLAVGAPAPVLARRCRLGGRAVQLGAGWTAAVGGTLGMLGSILAVLLDLNDSEGGAGRTVVPYVVLLTETIGGVLVLVALAVTGVALASLAAAALLLSRRLRGEVRRTGA